MTPSTVVKQKKGLKSLQQTGCKTVQVQAVQPSDEESLKIFKTNRKKLSFPVDLSIGVTVGVCKRQVFKPNLGS